MKLTCIRTVRKHVEALQLEDVKQIVTISYIVETERKTVSNRIAGATAPRRRDSAVRSTYAGESLGSSPYTHPRAATILQILSQILMVRESYCFLF